jgi:hypothetical protein
MEMAIYVGLNTSFHNTQDWKGIRQKEGGDNCKKICVIYRSM